MTKPHHILFALVLATAFCACQEIEDTDLEANEIDQALWSYPNQGEIAYGEIVENTLTGGDFGHYYRYEGQAGEEMTFALEWNAVPSSILGADIWIKDSSGNTLEQLYSWDPEVHIDITIPATGTYYLYVAHNIYGWFGSFPYTVGAEPHMCAELLMSHSQPEYQNNAYVWFENFAPGATGSPYTVMPGNEQLIVDERVVHIGPCNEIVHDGCDASDPEVCGGTLDVTDVFNNECAFLDFVAMESGTKYGAAGAWSEDFSISPACSE